MRKYFLKMASKWEEMLAFVVARKTRFPSLAVFLIIVNGGFGLFYAMLRSRLVDSAFLYWGVAVAVSVIITALWLVKAPLRNRAAASLVNARAEGQEAISLLPQNLQGPSEARRLQARAKRKKKK